MLAQKQGLSLEQGLRLNQQMLHSIKLLELPALELRERIEEELAANPALDMLEQKKESDVPDTLKEEKDNEDFFEKALSPPARTLSSGGTGDEKRQFLEGALAREESLQDALLWQLRLQKLPPDVLNLAELIIGNLDEDGFHIVPPEELLPSAVSASTPALHAALKAVQSLEPQGCATSDYKESLAVQARLRFGAEDWAAHLERLFPFLSELLKGKFAAVARETGIKSDSCAFLYERIKELSPFPGRQFQKESAGVRFVAPDIEVYRKDGELLIRLNDEEIPALRVNPFFEELDKQKLADKKAQNFLKQNIAGAKWFIGAVRRRNETLLRMTREIVERQWLFFEKGPAFLAPLTQHEVAEKLEIDDSTVSRLASGKYIQTEWGLFEARRFFSSAVPSSLDGGQFSKTGVKEVIKEIILRMEKRPSDNEVSHLLEERGIKIARRTVAKYRNEIENARR